MIEGVGEAVIACEPEAVVAFVTDLHRYKLADHKIGRVFECRQDGERFFMRHDGRLRGVPGPAVSLEMVVEGRWSVRYRGVPTFPSSAILRFDGGFAMTPAGDGLTRVVHTERFHFFWPWRLVAEPFLRAWLTNDVGEEMVRFKALLEASA
jgi:hypothetical protein